MGLLNEQLRGDKPDFGKIDIQNNFSFFEVERGFASKLIDSVKNVSFEGRGISIELAKQDEKSRKVNPKRKGKKFSKK